MKPSPFHHDHSPWALLPRDELPVVTRFLAQLEADIGTASARMPWLDEESAVEQVLKPAVKDVAAGLTKAQLHTLAGVLERLAREFSRAAPHAGETHTS